ncbi:MAG: hypothetical protein R2746_04420 [Acidimicrobiales bacterium]
MEAGEVWITEPVVLEVLQGGRSESHVRSLQGLLWRARLLAVDSADYAEAAFLHRVCRANGVTVRSSLDCDRRRSDPHRRARAAPRPRLRRARRPHPAGGAARVSAMGRGAIGGPSG